MIAILKAFRDALVADATLLTLVPAANIYAGLRDEKTPIPAIDVFPIPSPDERYAGAAIGGLTKATEVMQISVFQVGTSDAMTIADRIREIMIGDNATLNTVGVQNIEYIGGTQMIEANMIHIPMRYRFNYHYKIT
ncbi:MAG: DUF3168 domain-containing protein [Chloroflexota bacterium]|nr:DUF3168 domain-containing protein [Chloroflexota bacterium]